MTFADFPIEFPGFNIFQKSGNLKICPFSGKMTRII